MALSTSSMAGRSLILLVMAAAIPVLLFGGWVAFLNARQDRNAARLAAFEALDRVASRVTAELATQVELAEALAASASLDQPDLEMFYREAKRLKDAHPLWETIELVDTEGRQVLNLLRPMGTQLGATADRENFNKVVQTQKAAIGGIGPLGPISGKRLVALRAPVKRDERITFVLTIALVPDAVSQILRSAGAPKGWVGLVADAKGNIVARTIKEEFELGRPASESVRGAIQRGSEGAYVGRTLEGVEVDAVYRSLPGTGGWSVHLGLPTESLNAPVRRSQYLLAGGGAVSIALAVALAWLTSIDLAQRRRAQEAQAAIALGLSEERRKFAIEAAELGVFNWNLKSGEVLVSHRAQDLLNLPARLGESWDRVYPHELFLAGIHPSDRDLVAKALKGSVHETPTVIEFRTRDVDHNVRWRRVTGRPSQVNPDMHDIVFGVVMDIDAAKQAEIERIKLLRRLSVAEENERRRIARELHDQIGQSVTGLLLGLKNLEHSIGPGVDRGRADRVLWLQTLANGIGRDLHRVATDLRPTALDDLGLHDAVKALCSEWSRRFHIKVDLQILGPPNPVPLDIEIAVYRAIQEALTNILKHAKAQNVSVVIDQRLHELRAVVEDDGVGFSPEGAAPSENERKASGRLGLSGMRERLNLIGGMIAIESEPGVGTTLFISIPLGSGREA
ncbi:ATP-binding protein [Bradyrhizobium icense]|uniref:Oxygen sensor histidine kinase NreB n=1 Tax=Bradyrhizobium icense TaxID=1274631 RepID=A0A1B1UDV0_9BRAD|nr:ATP-binding protein [Bradyrhizobium icense]ANW00921.1 two-component sensor histidine kinase [Bradyrhizobium icense]